jgi:hypothetical protein
VGVAGLGEALARLGPFGQRVALDDGDVGVLVQGGRGQQAGQPAADDDGMPGGPARRPMVCGVGGSVR